MDIHVATNGTTVCSRRLPQSFRISPYDRFHCFGTLWCEFNVNQRHVGTYHANAVFERERPRLGQAVLFRTVPPPMRGDPPMEMGTDRFSACVYILKLERGRYYVGMTSSLNMRIWQHVHGVGALYTRIYPPLQHVDGTYTARIIYPATRHTERIVAERMIRLYGKEHVRGGPWCQLTRDDVRHAVCQREGENALTCAVAALRRRAIHVANMAATAASVAAADASVSFMSLDTM